MNELLPLAASAVFGAGVMRVYDNIRHGWRPSQVRLVHDNIALGLALDGALDRLDDETVEELKDDVQPEVQNALGDDVELSLQGGGVRDE
jgi:hypothetical protein